jgi:hypothetical protein
MERENNTQDYAGGQTVNGCTADTAPRANNIHKHMNGNKRRTEPRGTTYG